MNLLIEGKNWECCVDKLIDFKINSEFGLIVFLY